MKFKPYMDLYFRLPMHFSSVPNHDQAFQQVVMLKKEVAELRAQQATTSTPGMQVAQTSMVEEQVKISSFITVRSVVAAR